MPRRWITWIGVGALAVVALAAGLYVGHQASRDTEARDSTAAKAIAGLALPDAEGTLQPFAQWRGRLLVVNFWATWCAPCRDEMPLFKAAQQQYAASGVQFVGIAADSVAKVREFSAQSPLGYPTVIGGYSAIELSQTLGNRLGALPFTVIVDRGGNVVFSQLGPFTEDKLNAIITQLL